MTASVAIQVLPKTDSDEELCRIVDEVIAYIAGTGLRYEVGAYETTIEGTDYDQLMDIVKECQKVISPSSGASDSAVEEASVEAAVLVSAMLAAVEEEPPQPASRDAAIPAASRDASAFFMCLTSCDQICCVLVCSWWLSFCAKRCCRDSVFL